MRAGAAGGTFPRMELWVLTIVVCSVVWVAGTILVALGANWLVHHQPD
ncbi:MAG TPA: hypothetical protein VI408_05530 [Gaiellaceae bacterium]